MDGKNFTMLEFSRIFFAKQQTIRIWRYFKTFGSILKLGLIQFDYFSQILLPLVHVLQRHLSNSHTGLLLEWDMVLRCGIANIFPLVDDPECNLERQQRSSHVRLEALRQVSNLKMYFKKISLLLQESSSCGEKIFLNININFPLALFIIILIESNLNKLIKQNCNFASRNLFLLWREDFFLYQSFSKLMIVKFYSRNIAPTENVAVSALSMGEGWHNYHHVFPWDYKCAELANYFNNTARLIEFFHKMGWAYDLKQPSDKLVKMVIQNRGDGSHWKEVEPPTDEVKKDHWSDILLLKVQKQTSIQKIKMLETPRVELVLILGLITAVKKFFF